MKDIKVAFVGTVGIPNRYGGFEAFLEHCAPLIAKETQQTTVTCYAGAYSDKTPLFKGVHRVFLNVPANGAYSIFHDFLAFFKVFFQSTHIVFLGVSGGPWFPLFRLLCSLAGKRLLVNVDGVEWKRGKFSPSRRLLLRIFDALAQISAHKIVYDNSALFDFILKRCQKKAHLIAYSGDHVLRVSGLGRFGGSALTVCRIEPENNIELLIEGFLGSDMPRYVFVGNWNSSDYGKAVRQKFGGDKRLSLLDPIYDLDELSKLRESCSVYLHGHSVGGTNPSLVEMIFYDCRILCFDVPYHRETAGGCAEYFQSGKELSALLNREAAEFVDREQLRRRYSSSSISSQYLDLFE